MHLPVIFTRIANIFCKQPWLARRSLYERAVWTPPRLYRHRPRHRLYHFSLHMPSCTNTPRRTATTPFCHLHVSVLNMDKSETTKPTHWKCSSAFAVVAPALPMSVCQHTLKYESYAETETKNPSRVPAFFKCRKRNERIRTGTTKKKPTASLCFV